MIDRLICPACGRENTLGVNQCAHCGVVMRHNTTLVSAAEVLGKIQRPDVDFGSRLEENTLHFYIAGTNQNESLVHRGKSNVILGRHVENPGPEPVIDLSDYQAFALGVSRRHVRINATEDGYTIEDLHSSNGTWLNGNRLEPEKPAKLRRGDHIQLGELMMFVYFFQAGT